MGFLIKRKELPTMKGLIVQLIYVKVQYNYYILILILFIFNSKRMNISFLTEMDKIVSKCTSKPWV